MIVQDFATLFDYGYWANAKLFDVMSRLPEDDFTRPVAGSYGSLRNTLVHMASAEAAWLDRCGGPARGPKFDPDDFPTLASVVERWAVIEQRMRAFLDTITDADLDRRVEFVIVPGTAPHVMKIGELLQHAAVHSVHHRGQVALLIRMLGHAPVNVDALFYFGEKEQGAPAV